MESKPSEPYESTESGDERLLRECLERIDAEGRTGADALLQAHPVEGPRVRAMLANLEGLGVLRSVSNPDAGGVPDRLGDFKLVRKLGAGGMGVVFVAEQESLSRQVALKVVRPEHLFASDQRGLARFRREVAAVARMHHPGIVPIYAVGESGGVPYFAMELLEGCTLAEALHELAGRPPRDLAGADLARAVAASARARGFDPRDVRATAPVFAGSWIESSFRVALSIAEALAHVHSRGVIHRDVKPSNIALTTDGRAMLLDFGLASTGDGRAITQTGLQPGSLPYMSPEQLRGEKHLDHRTDLYSLGLTLFEMLTLRQPFTGGSSDEVRRRILEGPPVAPHAFNRGVSWDADTVCVTAMEPDRRRRYATGDALARDLSNVLGLRAIEARRPSTWLRARRWVRRRPTAGLAIAMTSLGILIAASVLLWTWANARRRVGDLLREADRFEATGRIEEAIEQTGKALGIRPLDERALEYRERLLASARARATRDLEEILRLADVKKLRDLVSRAGGLWPAFPDRITDIDSWLHESRRLHGNLETHRRALADVTARIDQARPAPPSPAIAWQHEVLTDLVSGLDALPSLIDSVGARLDFARTVEERTVTGAEAHARWRDAIADINALPVYGGGTLAAQLGLLPLWRHPQSGLWEFLLVQTGEPPARDRVTGTLITTPRTGLVLVLVPGGTFRMGSELPSETQLAGAPNVDRDSHSNETPVHSVTLDAFFLSKLEMTQSQWQRATGRNPSVLNLDSIAGGMAATNPVETVTWQEATRVLARLGLSLPTEAQWEYACRAGTTTVFSWGDDPGPRDRYARLSPDVRGWEVPLSLGPVTSRETSPRATATIHQEVGQLEPNLWGFHDMHGNVWEWCLETGAPDTGYTTPPRAGDGYRSCGERPHAICRGGSYTLVPYFARSATRSAYIQTGGKPDIGIRPARALTR